MTLLNEQSEAVDNEITSRYTIVIAVAKRARQIISGSEPLAEADTDKAVSIAVREIAEGKLHIKTNTTKNEAEPMRVEALNLIEAENLDDQY
ncbi:MAG: DNA-directed RNA polymerase subunit omega [Clostridiales bacterium]|jgi:DNA-directed RNA polymerase subunit omega|nr:DNA-directed RNA polymerase subunit omega [Clostridiales bacterium]